MYLEAHFFFSAKDSELIKKNQTLGVCCREARVLM